MKLFFDTETTGKADFRAKVYFWLQVHQSEKQKEPKEPKEIAW